MKRVVDAIEGVTAVLLFAGCALHRWSLHYRHGLLIIAQLLLLRAVDSFKVSRRHHARRR